MEVLFIFANTALYIWYKNSTTANQYYEFSSSNLQNAQCRNKEFSVLCLAVSYFNACLTE